MRCSAISVYYVGDMNSTTLIHLALSLAISQGIGAVERAFTPPEQWVRGVCKSTGANPELALEERNESAKAWAEFIGEMADIEMLPAMAEDLGLDAKPQAQTTPLPGLNVSLIDLSITIYRVFGKSALQRMLTIPEKVIKTICAKTGADFEEVKAARNAATEELVEFIESLVDKHFKDQD